MKRLSARWLAALVLLFILVSGWSTGAPETKAAAPPEKVLVVSQPQEIRTLDPRVSANSNDYSILNQILEPLLNVDQAGNLQPGLAERWKQSADGLTVTFYLRRGVKFHDGSPFNAEAVKFTFDTIVDPALGSLASIDMMGPYGSSRVIDDYTVEVKHKSLFAPFLPNLTTPYLAIVSPKAVKEMGNEKFAKNPIGTGPYKFVEWIVGDRVVLAKNPDYNWAPPIYTKNGPPSVDKIIYRYLIDPSSRASSLEAGETDLITDTPLASVQRLTEKGLKTLTTERKGLIEQYWMNTQRAPTNELAVRQALIYGINRQDIVRRLSFGIETVAYSIFSPSSFGYWKGAHGMYAFSPNKAAYLLDKAGWKMGPDGIRVKNGKKLTILDLTDARRQEQAQIIQSMMKDIGVDWKINIVTTAVRNEAIMANEYNVRDGFWAAPDPDIARTAYQSANIPTAKKFGYAWSKSADPRIDKLLNAGLKELNPNERAKIYQQFQQVVMNEALAIPMYNQNLTVTHSGRLSGFRFGTNRFYIDLYEVMLQ